MGPVLLHNISGVDAVVFGDREQVEGVRRGVCDAVSGGHRVDAERAAAGWEHHLLPELECVGLLSVSAGRQCAGMPSEQHQAVPECGGGGRFGVELLGRVSFRQHSSAGQSEGSGSVPGPSVVHHSWVSGISK